MTKDLAKRAAKAFLVLLPMFMLAAWIFPIGFLCMVIRVGFTAGYFYAEQLFDSASNEK